MKKKFESRWKVANRKNASNQINSQTTSLLDLIGVFILQFYCIWKWSKWLNLHANIWWRLGAMFLVNSSDVFIRWVTEGTVAWVLCRTVAPCTCSSLDRDLIGCCDWKSVCQMTSWVLMPLSRISKLFSKIYSWSFTLVVTKNSLIWALSLLWCLH